MDVSRPPYPLSRFKGHEPCKYVLCRLENKKKRYDDDDRGRILRISKNEISHRIVVCLFVSSIETIDRNHRNHRSIETIDEIDGFTDGCVRVIGDFQG